MVDKHTGNNSRTGRTFGDHEVQVELFVEGSSINVFFDRWNALFLAHEQVHRMHLANVQSGRQVLALTFARSVRGGERGNVVAHYVQSVLGYFRRGRCTTSHILSRWLTVGHFGDGSLYPPIGHCQSLQKVGLANFNTESSILQEILVGAFSIAWLEVSFLFRFLADSSTFDSHLFDQSTQVHILQGVRAHSPKHFKHLLSCFRSDPGVTLFLTSTIEVLELFGGNNFAFGVDIFLARVPLAFTFFRFVFIAYPFDWASLDNRQR